MRKDEVMLRIENVRCGYEDSFEISDISIDVPKSCLAGIIGPNGAGKTTLFRGIMGEISLMEGRVVIAKPAPLVLLIAPAMPNPSWRNTKEDLCIAWTS